MWVKLSKKNSISVSQVWKIKFTSVWKHLMWEPYKCVHSKQYSDSLDENCLKTIFMTIKLSDLFCNLKNLLQKSFFIHSNKKLYLLDFSR